MSEAQQLIDKINKEHHELKSRVVALEANKSDPTKDEQIKALTNALADQEAKLARIERMAAFAEPSPEAIVDDILSRGISRGAKSSRPWFVNPKQEAAYVIRTSPEYRRAFEKSLREGGNGGERLAANDPTRAILEFRKIPERFEKVFPDEIKSALSTDFEPGAGFFAPPHLESEIDRAVLEYSAIAADARVVNISKGSYEYNLRTNNRDTIQTGVGERVVPNQVTQLKRYEKKRIDVFESTCFPAITNTMLEDSDLDLTAEIMADAGEDFEVDESRQWVEGTGDGEAMGFMTDPGVPIYNSGYAATFKMESLINLTAQLKLRYRGNSKFYMSRSALTTAMLWRDDSGGAGTGMFLWQPSTQAGAPSLLLGHRWSEVVEMDAVAANAYPVAFGDMYRGYRIVRRRGIRVVRDEITEANSVIFRMTKRFGGGVARAEALVKLKCST